MVKRRELSEDAAPFRAPSEVVRVVHVGDETHSIGLRFNALRMNGALADVAINIRPEEAAFLARRLLLAVKQKPEIERARQAAEAAMTRALPKRGRAK